MRTRLTERDINRIVNNIINENDDFVTGVAASKRTELVDDVINRINEYGNEYMYELNSLNSKFPVERYKRMDKPRRSDFELPKGVKVKSSYFPED
jgi:hypothetical protein